MIKAIVFDWGGVIVYPVTRRIAKEVQERFGIDENKVVEVYHSDLLRYEKGEVSSQDFWKNFCDKLENKLTTDDIKNIISTAEKERPGMIECIKKLKQHYKVALLSNNNDFMVDFIRKNFDISFFYPAIFSNEVGITKPDKRIYLLTARRLGVKPKECLFVDDNIKNIKGARDVGMKAVHFEDYKSFKDELDSILKQS